MLATTSITFSLVIAFVNPQAQLMTSAATTVAGFGSLEACQAGIEIAKGALSAQKAEATMFCLPVDAARPLPNVLRQLVEPLEEGQEPVMPFGR